MKTKGILAVILAAVMVVSLICGCSGEAAKDENSSTISNSQETNQKEVTVKIKFNDGEEKSLQIKTEKEFLADALLEQKLITEEEYNSGFYTYIDGVRADYNEDKAWWCVYENGESAMVGMNELELDNGDEFEIVYTPA